MTADCQQPGPGKARISSQTITQMRPSRRLPSRATGVLPQPLHPLHQPPAPVNGQPCRLGQRLQRIDIRLTAKHPILEFRHRTGI